MRNEMGEDDDLLLEALFERSPIEISIINIY